MTNRKTALRAQSSLYARLLLGTALCGSLALAAGTAQAQNASTSSIETVVVTGTNIRSAAPVGEPVIAIDRDAIEATAAVPAPPP